jgi:hypothetical protein
MKYAVVALLALIVAGSCFAQDMDYCESQETSCKAACCAQAGGDFSDTGEQYLCNTYDRQSSLDTYYRCGLECDKDVIDCIAPGSGCKDDYSSCISTCTGQGGTASDCEGACMNTAFTCLEQYMDNPEPSSSGQSSSCCGPSFILGALAFGVFLTKR